MVKYMPATSNTTFQVYPHWSLETPLLPARNRLARLEPIGIGTPEVECLTSYIARLAAEHCVSPRKLLYKEVLAPAGMNTVHYATSSEFSASLINGMGSLAGLTVDALEQLTIRHDLQYTTTLIWDKVLSTHLLLRTKKAWCPICYEERLSAGRPIYDPLIWAFKIVSLCPRHREPLCQVCPSCRRNLPFITTFSYPGFCSKCKAWLGASLKESNEHCEEDVASAVKKQISAAHTIGELLSCAVNFVSAPVLHDFTANLSKYVNQRASNSINLFSDLVSIWSGTVRRLLLGETKLSLKMLCLLCSGLNVSPQDLLSNRGNDAMLEKRHLMLESDIPLPKQVTPWDEVESALCTALEETPPPSMEAVARRMGYYPPKVKRHFPEQCEQIISRYWKYVKDRHPSDSKIRKAFRAALKEHPPPSLQRVVRRLGCKSTGYYYYSNYPDMCYAIAQRYKEYRNKPFNKNIDNERLRLILEEEPPSSLSEVAKRLGHSREFLRRKFPELTGSITLRYFCHQMALRKKRAQRLRHSIREAAQRIIASGQYVSEAKVREYVRERIKNVGRERLFKQAFREVKLEMGLIN
jgi:AraC-like DNA-binding protein